MISSVNIWRKEVSQRFGDRRQLRSSKEVKQKEDGQDESESQGCKTGIEEDGRQKHDNHHTMKDFPASIDFGDGAESEDDSQADYNVGDKVGADHQARVSSSESDLSEVFCKAGAKGL